MTLLVGVGRGVPFGHVGGLGPPLAVLVMMDHSHAVHGCVQSSLSASSSARPTRRTSICRTRPGAIVARSWKANVSRGRPGASRVRCEPLSCMVVIVIVPGPPSPNGRAWHRPRLHQVAPAHD